MDTQIKATHSPKGVSNTAIAATYIDHMGSDLSVVNAARVSFGKISLGECIEYDIFSTDPEVLKAAVAKYKEEGWVITSDVNDWKVVISRPTMGDTKLIKYLAKHRHISPFGHAFASFHVKAPIFVARQLVKHKFLRWNEVSRRYVDDEPEFYTPDAWRGRSADKKQGSEGVVDYGVLTDFYDRCMFEYSEMLEFGVAPEQARMVLPQSTLTEWYWSGSLDAFADMCRLRCKEDTQYESRIVANQISTIMQDLYPVSWASLMELEV
ncbi:thymidylate synthase [Celeribacter phage P12053L]|uniref:Thymidylate synthase n=1 Tax=Celeribacter phage P12053L TaxID=1197951 RepID=I6S269_9CAUD|nr:thymidylate synthase [Celeribacter phage P12053L]AFM54612.1 thymidylate synthase [Celeribacter phage P12053L]